MPAATQEPEAETCSGLRPAESEMINRASEERMPYAVSVALCRRPRDSLARWQLEMRLAGGVIPAEPRGIPGIFEKEWLVVEWHYPSGSLPATSTPSNTRKAGSQPQCGTRAGKAPRVSQHWGGTFIRPGASTEDVEGQENLSLKSVQRSSISIKVSHLAAGTKVRRAR